MVKTDMLAFRVEADVKAALERAAKADERSVSGLADRILREWLTKHGDLKPPVKPKATGRKKGGVAR